MANLGTAMSTIVRFKGNLLIAQEVDANFDGGEFSGPAHARAYPQRWRRTKRLAKSQSGLSRSAFNRLLNKTSVQRAIGRATELYVARQFNW